METLDTLAKIAATELNDRDIMWIMGVVRGCSLDLEDFKEAISRGMKNEKAKVLFRGKMDDLLEFTEAMEFELDDIMEALDISVDEDGHYPVLFRGKEKSFNWVNLCNIECDSLPLNKEGFKTAQLVRGHVPIPPIRLTRLEAGNYRVDDGRHRFLAFKLNGLEKIPAYVHDGRRGKFLEAMHKTGKEHTEVFRRLT